MHLINLVDTLKYSLVVVLYHLSGLVNFIHLTLLSYILAIGLVKFEIKVGKQSGFKLQEFQQMRCVQECYQIDYFLLVAFLYGQFPRPLLASILLLDTNPHYSWEVFCYSSQQNLEILVPMEDYDSICLPNTLSKAKLVNIKILASN